MPARTSHEKQAVDRLLELIGPLDGVTAHRGPTADNRIGVQGWSLTQLQKFQFGDLRLEGSGTRVVFEIESAGGVGNLAKYWPMLRTTLRDKHFVLVHIYSIASGGDYIAHRRLWEFLVEKMKQDLGPSTSWEAHLLSYGPGAGIDELPHAAALARSKLEQRP
jgi:hypothetical protein